ncbi:MAG: UDP-3-O-[3-hydroxymyristoyl] N-acetylglucosamine deacetylase [Spirochaetes bacterium GWF1_41_5]|nr:MAG: UDP-3-O-[3-hydroxymyristoyl] N-acetylglucosamine deacetylase [Spirochaetes bacterium GWF1_41_5]
MYKILVIDDEENIHKSIKPLLEDEGFSVSGTTNPAEGLSMALSADDLSLLILDIWMPDLDGTQVLQAVREKKKNLPILIMSGHANIDTAVQLTKAGANALLEKPFSSDQLLKKIADLLDIKCSSQVPSWLEAINSYPGVYKQTVARQCTIRQSRVLTGLGLHSGIKTGIICMPLPPDSGIIFEDLSTEQRIPALFNNVKSTAYATTLQLDQSGIMCIEHLMAVLNIYGIDNILIKINGEVPIFDGSALKFCEMIEECGIEKQSAPKKKVIIEKTVIVRDSKNHEKYIKAEPFKGFCIDYFLDFPEAFGKQHYLADFSATDNTDVFKKQIAPARTFGFISETKELQKSGLASGAKLENSILIDADKVINTELRFPDEFARHKILDIAGDLYLLGAGLEAKITARMTGHRNNIALIKKILGKSATGV